jgi:hypothetical protein
MRYLRIRWQIAPYGGVTRVKLVAVKLTWNDRPSPRSKPLIKVILSVPLSVALPEILSRSNSLPAVCPPISMLSAPVPVCS